MMETLDYAVIGAYFALIFAMSAVLARRQRSGEDFFLAGRSMGGGILALSIMANQASAVSLVGAPAFVALSPGGGLRWLQYELALPVAMLLVIVLLLPLLRSVEGTSIYGFAERRFGIGTRRVLAIAFLLSRGLAAGVILYAAALVVAPVTGISVVTAVMATGLFCVAYSVLGGIVADIWSDVVQLAVLWGGVLISTLYVVWRDGAGVLAHIPLDRAQTIVVDSFGVADGQSFALAPMFLGGIILYVSYYACDQTQAQRLLAASDDSAARMALLLNGLLRFPLVLTYCLFGLFLAALLQSDPDFAARMADQPPDTLVPTFLMAYLPAGIRGLLVAAILAAAMSSLDSALNSLAAVTLDDVAHIDTASRSAWIGRGVTFLWGCSAVASALVFASGTTGVLELITMLGSLFYGPILVVFIAGALMPSVTGRGALAGLLSGIAANVAAATLSRSTSSLWWNVIGLMTGMIVAIAVSRLAPAAADGGWVILRPRWPRRHATVLLAAAVLMFALVAVLPALLSMAK